MTNAWAQNCQEYPNTWPIYNVTILVSRKKSVMRKGFERVNQQPQLAVLPTGNPGWRFFPLCAYPHNGNTNTCTEHAPGDKSLYSHCRGTYVRTNNIQIWFVNIREYMAFGSITGSAYYLPVVCTTMPPRNRRRMFFSFISSNPRTSFTVSGLRPCRNECIFQKHELIYGSFWGHTSNVNGGSILLDEVKCSACVQSRFYYTNVVSSGCLPLRTRLEATATRSC